MELKLLQNLIQPNDIIAVALSGGEDSMTLLHALLGLRKKLNFTLKAINVEHGIRGNESINDSKFCIEQATTHNIEIKSISVNAPEFSKTNGYSLEQGARMLRYQVFDELLNQGFATKIATAHHKSDNFETVLFNMFRGCGASGIVGIKQKNSNIIRPLLNVTKQEIKQYVDYHHIPYVQDASNFDTEFSRNYLRQEIMPKIIEKFPSAESSTLRMSENIAKDDELLYELAESYLTFSNGNAQILYCDKQPLFARASILAMKASGISKDYSSTHINLLFELQKSETGKQINLINGVIAIKEYNKITLYKQQIIADNPQLTWNNNNLVYSNYKITVEEIDRNCYDTIQKPCYNAINGQYVTIFADAYKLLGSTVRSPQQGDVFKKIGGGSKSLKKHLVDKKLAKSVRHNFPVLTKGNNVLLIFGIEPSIDVIVDKNTTKILKITINN